MNALVQVANPEQEYQQLKTELMICVSGGLFLGLYQDDKIPAYIISRLQNDLPQQFNFELHLNKDKTNFPVFFRYLFEDINQHASVYHVLGIDELVAEVLQDFLKNLQYNRDNFKAAPYSLVFWIKADFVSTLFHAAPDFYHWLFGNYDFSFQPQQQPEFINHCLQAQQQLQQEEQQFLSAIRIYLEKLVWQYEHWQEVKTEEFLNEVMSRADLNRYYVSLHCTDQNGKTWLLDDLLNHFLANSEQSFLALLGDFGTGKSSFSLYYFIQQARRYLQDSAQRIPLFISLKDYPKQFQLAEFIEKEFFQRLGLPFHTKALQNLALQGQFLFFFDGFDEMVSMANEQETIDNFKTITHLSFENLQFLTQKNKVATNKLFLTCRSHYFLNDTQEQNILKADKTVLYRNYATKTQYQISRMAILQFEQEQIEQYIRKNTESENQALEFIAIIRDTYNLTELSTRPLLLDMIVKTLPLLKDKAKINAADLYHAYTSEWIKRDDWRSCLTAEGKRQVMWDLSLKMVEKSGDFSLHYSELAKPDKDFFKNGNYDAVDEGYFIYEATACSFLNRDLTGSYKFIHKSFMEYFFAECLHNQEIKNERRKLLDNLLITEGVWYFLKAILSNRKCLNNLHLSLSNLCQINGKKQRLYILCAHFLTEQGIEDSPQLTAEVRTEIIKMIATPEALTISERAEAGRVLAVIGDNRLGVGVNDEGLPDIKWQKIPEGRVTINKKSFAVEAFYLAAYTITNTQFQCFIDDPNGYKNPHWWEGLDAKSGTPVKPRWSEANHPREKVSWIEAMAFCAWVSERLGFNIRLPTEWQWQQAACSGETDFSYPWGKDYQSGYANINETSGNVGIHNLQRTTAVGLYPHGNSHQGVADLGGNVWEWCLNEYDTPENRPDSEMLKCEVRGGSWIFSQVQARASYRHYFFTPGSRRNTIGFRVCCVYPILNTDL